MSDSSAYPAAPPQDEDRPLLLLVEDEAALRRSMQLLLHTHGYNVRAFPSAEHALADLGTLDAKIVVCDYRLPMADGIDMLCRLKERNWSGHAVLVTAYPSDQLSDTARAAGYAIVLPKPIPAHRLIAAIGAA